MKKFFAIMAAALLVVACGGTKTVEDQLLVHIAKIEKAATANDYEQTRAAARAYYEWEESLNASQEEELAVALIKHDAYIMKVLSSWDEMQVEREGCYEEEAVAMVYSNSYDGYLNVRAQPSSKSQVVGTLHNGPDGAELLGVEGKWTKVRVNGTEGYVWSANIQSTPTEPVHINASAVVGDWVWSNGSRINEYTIKDNGKFEYMTSGDEGNGTWYLSGSNLILKHAGGRIVTCNVYGKTIVIEGLEYERM